MTSARLIQGAAQVLRAPFPWFGGKSRVAHLVWPRFGVVNNYVEPFFGSGSVLLARPDAPKTETVNDRDGHISNFWRAVQAAPEDVAHWADWPVNEADLHARHRWLKSTGKKRLERLMTDPEFFDAKVAGWWVWGICQWIGSGWCSDERQQVPRLSAPGQGVHAMKIRVSDTDKGVHSRRMHLGRGMGVQRRQIPHIGDKGRGVHNTTAVSLEEWFEALQARLRRVRVCVGDWSRVVGRSVLGLRNPGSHDCGMLPCGVFLDPPYGKKAKRASRLYAVDSLTVAEEVRLWAVENGGNEDLRIALCGYEGEHEMPESWECVPWKAHCGFAGQNLKGNRNAGRERIWFSPHCLKPAAQLQQSGLFDLEASG